MLMYYVLRTANTQRLRIMKDATELFVCGDEYELDIRKMCGLANRAAELEAENARMKAVVDAANKFRESANLAIRGRGISEHWAIFERVLDCYNAAQKPDPVDELGKRIAEFKSKWDGVFSDHVSELREIEKQLDELRNR